MPTPAKAPFTELLARVGAGTLSPESARHIYQRLHSFRKAEEGQRHEHRPFGIREQFAEDERPGTARYAQLRSVVDGIDQELLTDGLQARMGVDSQRPPDPITLRDQIEAAVEAHTR